MSDLARFIREKWLEIVIVGVCIHLFCAAIVIWLEHRPTVLILVAVAIVLLLFALFGLRNLRRRLRVPKAIGTLDAFKVPRRGVIVTLGFRSTEPNSVVFQVKERFNPDFWGFLGTPETDTAKITEQLVKQIAIDEDNFKSEAWEPTRVAEGVTKTQIVIDWMLEQGLDTKDIVLDLTAGTATASIAAFMASQERHIDCQYIYSQYRDNQVVEGSQKPILITRYTLPSTEPNRRASP